MSAIGSQACPYLGRCDDAESYYFFPTVDNCCHTEKRPFAVAPAHQAKLCLDGNWSDCPRYVAAKGSESGEAAVAPSSPAPQERSLSQKTMVGILAAGAILLVALFLILRPRPASLEPLAANSSPTPTFRETASTGEPTSAPFSPTSAIESTEEPVPTQPQATATPTATASATRTPTASPSPIPSRTPSVTPTRTASATLTRTPTRTRTPSPSPTLTQTAAPILTPVPTLSPSASPTGGPIETATPLPAPVLLAPSDGQVFSAGDEVALAWQPLAGLPVDGYYAISVAYTHGGATWHDEVPWTQDTSWTLSEHSYLLDLSDDGWFRWSVQAVRQTGFDAAGAPEGSPLGPASKVWSFRWATGSGGGSTSPLPETPSVPPTPLPPPP
jgi:hypothetical protein